MANPYETLLFRMLPHIRQEQMMEQAAVPMASQYATSTLEGMLGQQAQDFGQRQQTAQALGAGAQATGQPQPQIENPRLAEMAGIGATAAQQQMEAAERERQQQEAMAQMGHTFRMEEQDPRLQTQRDIAGEQIGLGRERLGLAGEQFEWGKEEDNFQRLLAMYMAEIRKSEAANRGLQLKLGMGGGISPGLQAALQFYGKARPGINYPLRQDLESQIMPQIEQMLRDPNLRDDAKLKLLQMRLQQSGSGAGAGAGGGEMPGAPTPEDIARARAARQGGGGVP